MKLQIHCTLNLFFLCIVILNFPSVALSQQEKQVNNVQVPEQKKRQVSVPEEASSTAAPSPSPVDPGKIGLDIILLPPSAIQGTIKKPKPYRSLKNLLKTKINLYEDFLTVSQKRVLETAEKTFGLYYSVFPVKRGSSFDTNDSPGEEANQVRAFELLSGIVGRLVRDTIACSSNNENSTSRQQAKCNSEEVVIFTDQHKDDEEEDILCTEPENALSEECKMNRADKGLMKVVRGPPLDFRISVQSTTRAGYSVILPSNGKLTEAIEHKIWKVSSPTKIIITLVPHEFMKNGKYITALQQKMIEAFTKRYGSNQAHNIVKIDWPEIFSKRLSISQVAARFLPTAEKLARIIKRWIKKKQIQLDQIHFIGASVGAHLAGAVGWIIKGAMKGQQIARITGLDPLGWGFDEMDGFGVDAEFELTKDDAEFVDIIHTSSPDPNYPFIHYGSNEKRGAADFYPNNGRSQYCSKTDGLCHHFYSIILYTASITGANFNGCQCTSWDDFIIKRLCLPCKDSAKMGEHIDPGNANGVYFLATA